MSSTKRDKAIVTRILNAKNPYQMLGIQSNATDDTIKDAFKKLELLVNPKKNTDPNAQKAYNALKDARKVLLNKNTGKIKQSKRLKTSTGSATDRSNQSAMSSCNNIDEVKRILNSKNVYEMLKIQNDATDDDIKNSFEKIFRQIAPEPDNPSEARQAIKALRRAVLLLMDKNERQKYDEGLMTSSKPVTDQLNLSEKKYTEQDEAIITRILNAKNYYELLEIQIDATDNDIKKAFRKLAVRVHPDKSNHPKAHDAFIALEKASAALLKKGERQKYDQSMRDPAGFTYQFNLSRDDINAILITAGVVTFVIGVCVFFEWLFGPEKEPENDSQNKKNLRKKIKS